MLAAQLRRSARFQQQTAERLLILEKVPAQHLDRDQVLELQVRRRQDDPHPAPPDLAFDAVLAHEDLTRHERVLLFLVERRFRRGHCAQGSGFGALYREKLDTNVGSVVYWEHVSDKPARTEVG